jgi:hypothetical protein
MTVKEVCEAVVSELRITFDEDPYNCDIDIIIPLSAEPLEILGDKILSADVNLMMAQGDTIIISTNCRK